MFKYKKSSIGRKLLCLFMVFVFLVGSVPIPAMAATATMSSIYYVRTKVMGSSTITNKLEINGTNFINPLVYGGIDGDIALTINSQESTANKIVIDIEGQPSGALTGMVIIRVLNNNGADPVGGTVPASGVAFDFTSTPTINTISSNKVYAGNPISITGFGFDKLTNADLLYIADEVYSLVQPGNPDGITITASQIDVSAVKNPTNPNSQDVYLLRKLGANNGVNRYIKTLYKDSISIVQPIANLEIERVDPNTGPKDVTNIITLYGKSGKSNFTADMKVYMARGGEILAGTVTTLELVKDSGNVTIGLKVKLPKMTTILSGPVDLVIKSSDGKSELNVPEGFIFIEAGNGLNISDAPDAITPSSKTETQDITVAIKGRNIGYFNSAGYTNIAISDPPVVLEKGYTLTGYPTFNDPNTYKVLYEGQYTQGGTSKDIVIIREITAIINDRAPVDTGATSPALDVQKSGDTIYVKPGNVAINEPLKVNVTVKTKTTIFYKNPLDGGIIFNRAEEYTRENGFTYVPDETIPTITSITPKYSQDPVGTNPTQEIYVNIKGKDFQVTRDPITDDPVYPTVMLTNGIKERVLIGVAVYTDTNELVDGRKYTLGTKLKCRIPKTGTDILSGSFNLSVENPSKGKNTALNAYEFKNPAAGAKLPIMNDVVEAYCDIKGGDSTGESSKITGLYIDKGAIFTIDGESAKVSGAVSADGKTVTIIAPPGTQAGVTKLQLINENGGVASFDFEYKKVTTSPKITKIMPVYGSKGTKLIIKGESFIQPVALGEASSANDPALKGSYVMFNEFDVNAYNYDITTGEIVLDATNSIYYSDATVKGHRAQVIDSNTIYVTVPDTFYTLKKGVLNPGNATTVLAGKYRIEVRNPDGAKTKENFTFDYMNSVLKPTITSVDPAVASASGGTTITVKGSDFLKTDIAVYFGVDQATKVEFISSSELRVLVPACTDKLINNELIVPLMVLNSDGSSAVYYDNSDPLNIIGFKYKIPDSKPVITSVTPNKGSTSGGDTIYIEGKQFWRKDPNLGDPEEPLVYINGKKAIVKWFQDGLVCSKLQVKTPSSLVEGPVDIILVNYDSGTAIFKGFSYVRTKPVIKAFTPDLIALNGNSNGYISGSNFTKWSTLSEMVIIDSVLGTKEMVDVSGIPTEADQVLDTLVYFGDVLTGDKKTIDSVGGPYFTIMDNLKITVDRKSDALTNVKISLASDTLDTPISGKDLDIEAGKSHLFIMTGAQQNKPLAGEEGILVRVLADSVTIQRRVAVQATLGDQDFTSGNSYASAMVTTPPFAKIGKRTAYLENADGAVASVAVTVTNPLSKPAITNITPKSAYKDTNGVIQTIPGGGAEPAAATVSEWYTYAPLAGGMQMIITGSDFREDVVVKLNEKTVDIIERGVNKDRLVIKIPAGVEADYNQLKRLIIINKDGASVDSSKLTKPHYVMYKEATSNPVVTSLSKKKTSKNLDALVLADLNQVTLNGSGFIPGMRVFVGNVECPQVDAIPLTGGGFDDTQMIVTLPKDLPLGLNVLQAVNPDNGFVEVKNAMEVISDPKIDYVKTDKGALISPLYLSIEGGQKIKLESLISRFTEGAKVIIGGKLKTKAEAATEGLTGQAGTNYQDKEYVIVGGVPATNVTLVDDKTLSLVTPRQTLGATTIIVLAADNGVSNVITGDYQKPYPDKPTGLVATPVDSNTAKLEWPKMEGVRYYEVYVSKSAAFKYDSAKDKYEYKGAVTPIDAGNDILRYFVEGLTPNTYYSFKLKAINNFGASKFSEASSKYVVNGKEVGFMKTMSTAITDNFQGTSSYKDNFTVEDKLSYQGRMSILTAGERSMAAGLLEIAYNKPQFILNDPKVFEANVALLRKYEAVNILMDDYNLTLQLMSGDLLTEQTESLSTESASDSKMRLTLDKRQGAAADQIKIRIPSGYGMVLQPMKIGLDLYQGKKAVAQSQFKNNVDATFKYASTKIKKYPGGVYIAYYNTYTRKLELINTTTGTGTSNGQVQKTGSYIIIGKKTK